MKRVYDCWWVELPETHIGVEANTRNKAKMITLLNVQDAYPCAEYKDIRARVDPGAKVHYKESAATVA